MNNQRGPRGKLFIVFLIYKPFKHWEMIVIYLKMNFACLVTKQLSGNLLPVPYLHKNKIHMNL